MPISNQLLALHEAVLAAPDDAAPRNILMDYLLEERNLEPQYANWNWYWNDLIPGCVAQLTSKETFPPASRSVHYGPTVAYSALHEAAQIPWQTAVIRTFVDQGGNPLWSRLPERARRYIAALEAMAYLYPLDYAVDLIKHPGGPVVPKLTLRPDTGSELIEDSGALFTLWDDCVRLMPVNNYGAIHAFLNALNEGLKQFAQEQARLAIKGIAVPEIHERYHILPDWTTRTLLYAARSHKRHREVLQDIYSTGDAHVL